MKRKFFFPLIAALLLVPWPVAYAYDGANAEDIRMTIQTADPSGTPQLYAAGRAIGSVTPGDLFQVDTTGITLDTYFNMFITNTDELVQNYRYMTLNVGIYVQTGIDSWEKLTAPGGEALPDIFITIQGGMVSFTLPGGAKYRITIEKGCFYCYGAAPGTTAAAPKFYLTAS
ncbi:MAG: hypothetical protein A2Y90_01005 [Chloroflexi bacterium RBG_13_52_12]|nr:MAG: hypothetical protein A2Y90_01005 [Chloroflexi bacterium RBG_13_52_12]